MNTPLPNARKYTQSCPLPQPHLSSTVHQHSSRVVTCEDLGPDPGAVVDAVNCTLDASPETRTARDMHSSRTVFRRTAALRDPPNPPRPFPLHRLVPSSRSTPAPHSNPGRKRWFLDANPGTRTSRVHALFFVALLRPATPPTFLALSSSRCTPATAQAI